MAIANYFFKNFKTICKDLQKVAKKLKKCRTFCVPFAQLPGDSISSMHVTTWKPARTHPPSSCRAPRSYMSSFTCGSMKFRLVWTCATLATIKTELPHRCRAPSPRPQRQPLASPLCSPSLEACDHSVNGIALIRGDWLCSLSVISLRAQCCAYRCFVPFCVAWLR